MIFQPDLHTVEILNPYGPCKGVLSDQDLHTVEILNPYGPSVQRFRLDIYTQ